MVGQGPRQALTFYWPCCQHCPSGSERQLYHGEHHPLIKVHDALLCTQALWYALSCEIQYRCVFNAYSHYDANFAA
jgi:hypothetical protein